MKTQTKLVGIISVIALSFALIVSCLAISGNTQQANAQEDNTLRTLFVSKDAKMYIGTTELTKAQYDALAAKGFSVENRQNNPGSNLILNNYTYNESDGFDTIIMDKSVYVNLKGENTINVTKDFSGCSSEIYLGKTAAPIAGNIASFFYGLQYTSGKGLTFSSVNKFIGLDNESTLIINYAGASNIDNFIGICSEALEFEHVNISIISPNTSKINVGILSGNPENHYGLKFTTSKITAKIANGLGFVGGLISGRDIIADKDSSLNVTTGNCATLSIDKPSITDIKDKLIAEGWDPDTAELIATIIDQFTTSISYSANVGIGARCDVWLSSINNVKAGNASLTKLGEYSNCYSIAIVSTKEVKINGETYVIAGNAIVQSNATAKSISLGIGSVNASYIIPFKTVIETFITLYPNQSTVINDEIIVYQGNGDIAYPVASLTAGDDGTASLTGEKITTAKTKFNIKSVVTTGQKQYIEPIATDEPVLLVDAAWTIYHVYFDAMGGLCDTPKLLTNTKGVLEQDLPTTTKEGYTFDGWFYDKEGKKKVAVGDQFTADTTVYAHWTVVPQPEPQPTPTPTPTPSKDTNTTSTSVATGDSNYDSIIMLVLVITAGISTAVIARRRFNN